MASLVEIKRGYLPCGTFGDLYVNGKFVCHTVERTWLDNKPNESCIPEGVYSLTKYESPRHGRSYIVEGGSVDKFDNKNGQRWGILFHPALLPTQLQGCIAPVSSITSISGKIGGKNSMKAVHKLFDLLSDFNELIITHKAAYDPNSPPSYI